MQLRTDHVNETYYAKRSAPTFSQFVGHYHFVDDSGRQYMIAERGQGDRLRFKPRSQKRGSLHCVTNTHGYILLYVKLPNKHTTHWFSHSEINQPLTLYRIGQNDPAIYKVLLKSSDKPDHRSATGSIYVDQLPSTLCQTILNEK